MPIARFQMPDGRVARFEVPDGTTPEQAQTMMEAHFAQQPSDNVEQKQSSTIDDIKQGVGNLAAGAIRGAGSIGATLLAPIDIAKDAISGKGLSLESNRERRKAIDAGLQEMGADPNSWMYQGGKLAGEIAGTAGVGGVAANAARGLGSAPSVVNALSSGGMSLGGAGSGIVRNALTRAGTGAVTGAAASGMVNPEDAASGTGIGAALPVVGIGLSKAIPLVGKGVAHVVGDLGRTGGENLKQAASAGLRGGKAAEQFIDNMRGNVPISDALDIAKSNLDAMGAAKSAEYRSGMVNIANDKTVLDFSGIDKAVKNAASDVTYKGQIKNVKAAEVQQKIADEIEAWKALNPVEYHTPEGLDALKQKISGIVDSIPMEEKTAMRVGSKIYNAIKTEIVNQAPEYAKVMKDYSQATETIREIERSLSLGNKSSADTAIRKLQSLTRNNANTNYGSRTALAQQLEQQGGQEIMPSLAGQSLNSWSPRGFGGLISGGAVAGGLMTSNPLAIPVVAAGSPRLMGEAAYAIGKGYGGASRAVNELAKKLGVSSSVAANLLYQNSNQ